jgi:protein-L-isoaspartate O-methyltransferase
VGVDRVFDDLYRRESDPWEIETSWYERRKRAIVLATLRCDRYGSAFEPGCGRGVMTAALAERCDHVHATDVSSEALRQARRRLGDHAHVSLSVAELPGGWPTGPQDLIVLSEILCFLNREPIETVVDLAAASLSPGGDLVLVDYTGGTEGAPLDLAHEIEGYPLDGSKAHAAFQRAFTTVVRHEDEQFVLQVLTR